MKRTPVSSLVPVSVDLVRDKLGTVPAILDVAGIPIRTTTGGAGKGMRPLWSCPSCQRRALLMYVNAAGRPACRACHRIAYPSSFLRRSPLEGLAAALVEHLV